MTRTVALREGLYREGPEGPILTGGRCSRCGFVGFPRPQTCLECGSDAVESADLGSRGELLCETTVLMRTDKYAAGYSVGYVTMAQGVRVFGQVRKRDAASLRPGQPMTVEVDRMWEEGDKEVLCYCFRPTAASAGGAA